MKSIHGLRMGWHRDLPDFRDHSRNSEGVSKILSKSRPMKSTNSKTPASIDLRQFCSPIEDQGQIGSCTANAGVGMVEYFERRAFGKHLDGSRLFLYWVNRKLGGFTGDSGAYLRDTMKALVLFGLPPEQQWPYQADRFDEEPGAFCYAYAQSYQASEYYRLDPLGTKSGDVLKNVRGSLAAGLPAMFGFSVYSSMPALGDGKGEIPFPENGDRQEGGHAVLAVGYDDKKKIGKSTGAILIRNSWSANWGVDGYGWLPYEYVEAGLADDFWSLVKAEFVDSDLFK